MAEITDYYQALEVDEGASAEDIKKAYRRLARANHPDRNPDDPGAEERFKAVQEAYEVLSDPEKRKAYDRARRNPFAGYGPGFGAGGPGGNGAEYVDLSDLFSGGAQGFADGGGFGDFISQIFDEPPRRRRPARGRDVETQVKLTFDQALRGGKTELRVGDGEPLRLTIPKGVRSGFKIRLRGRGRPGPGGGEAGDLYVTFRVEPSPRFRREGDTLHVVETVSAMEAILGTTRAITNAYGKTVKVTIPPGTQPGERLRLRGQGVETAKRAGDLYVEVQVSIPRHLTDEQRAGLEACARKHGIL
ncbi:MAG: J domain-containing protein [Rubricoccaceae bacterium]|nr:J domain-containing protein [Rubricoccaceae bacterium]